MSSLPVLIVGAGPAGLMMACELARHGIQFRIIDKKSEPTHGSNATWIQTRTLEIFDYVGLANDFLKIGHTCKAINFYAKGKVLATLSLSEIDSYYPFILMVPQSETERLLNNKLAKSNIQIERSLELIDIKQSKDVVISSVRHANGDIEEVTSSWVIACDGAHSTVREKCNIQFPGEDISEQFMVADAKMGSFLPRDEIHVFFDKGTIFPDKGTIFSAFPWGAKDYRLSANLYLEHARQTFTKQEVKEVVAERTYGNYLVEDVSWISPFWIHSKIVDRMQLGSIFLAGDAANVHSPAGGQGMNTGIQDAFNLAWKLALVVKGEANPSLLDSYQLERHPILKAIVTKTEHYTKMVLFDKSLQSTLRKFGEKLSEEKSLAKEIGEELTQIKIKYQNSPIIHYQQPKNINSPQPGERAPDVKINEAKNLYDYMDKNLHNILFFVGDKLIVDELKTIKELETLLNKLFANLINFIVIAKEILPGFKNAILDDNALIHKRYQMTEDSALYIVRPDNYIAYYSAKVDITGVQKFLHQYLLG